MSDPLTGSVAFPPPYYLLNGDSAAVLFEAGSQEKQYKTQKQSMWSQFKQW